MLEQMERNHSKFLLFYLRWSRIFTAAPTKKYRYRFRNTDHTNEGRNDFFVILASSKMTAVNIFFFKIILTPLAQAPTPQHC